MLNFLRDVEKKNFLKIENKVVKNLTELLEVLKGMKDASFSKYVSEKGNLIYEWISSAIGDETLARKIRNLRLRKNVIKRLEERIAFLKNVEYGLEQKDVIRELKFYVNSVVLEVDMDKCCRCTICSDICPKEAVKLEEKKLITEECVLCGFCVPFCPTGAIKLLIDGKERNIFTEQRGMPELPGFVEVNGYMVRKFLEGRIEIDSTRCPEECEECVSACPASLIKRDGEVVSVDEKKCLFCGACKAACPENAIKIRINRIVASGEGFSSTWAKAIEKLTGYSKSVLERQEKSTKKLVELSKKEVLRKWLERANLI